jgi:oligosaccharyltransferase complex subunit alpha (ribophorin I)
MTAPSGFGLETRSFEPSDATFRWTRLSFLDLLDRAAQFFKIVLPKPVPAGETVQLQITIVSTHSTENYPAKIGQADKASRLYTGNLHFLSPYKTDKEKLTIKWVSLLPIPFRVSNRDSPVCRTAAGKVHSHTPSAPTVSGNQYSYSSSDVAAFSREQVRIHFEVPAPMLKAESVKRTIEVSHWTSKAEFSEDWILWHDGPRLVVIV